MKWLSNTLIGIFSNQRNKFQLMLLEASRYLLVKIHQQESGRFLSLSEYAGRRKRNDLIDPEWKVETGWKILEVVLA